MPTDPIAISTTPPKPHFGQLPNQNTTTPSSSLSISPQTPFLPPPGMSPSNATATVTPTPSNSQGFFKWASTFAKSPGAMSPTLSQQQKGFDIPSVGDDNHDDHEAHDSFEFGDFSDLKSRSWSGRRTVSMSMAPGQMAGQHGNISSMLKGFGESPSPSTATNGTMPTPTQGGPAGGVMADKLAKGQGVLRRLSLSGSSYRPNFLSPPQQTPHLPSSPSISSASVPIPTPAPPPIMPSNQDVGPPQADAPIQRATTIGAAGRRRYSENGARRRGVSPMGERILREHGHF